DIRLMRMVPEGETVSMVEAPRGELLYFVKTDGRGGLQRLKVRTPTIPNVIALEPMLVGCEIADIPVVTASVDPCMACADRITVIDNERERLINWEKLRRRRKMQ
ncbi:MAG: NADH dehydrogenase subunit, partial [Candidatus Bathyarchaeia archaeon]